MEVWFGAAQVMLNEEGAGRLRLAEDQAMNGHLGYLKVSDSTGNELGEIEVLPASCHNRLTKRSRRRPRSHLGRSHL